jgi:archaellum component FlaC
MEIKMNKVIKIIMLTLIGVGCFGTGLYYSTLKFDEQLDNIMGEYEVISDKVDTFVDVSNPETIRLYTKELRRILDDIKFLHTLIETGQLADEALDDYLEEQQGNVDGLKESLLSITFEVSGMLDSSHTHIHGMVEELDGNVKTQLTNTTTEVMSKVDDLNKQITSLLKSIDTVQKDINVVKKSRYGKKIWKSTNK